MVTKAIYLEHLVFPEKIQRRKLNYKINTKKQPVLWFFSWLFIHLSFYLSIHASVCSFFYYSIYPFLHPFIYPSRLKYIHSIIYSPFYPFVHPFIDLSFHLSINSSFHLSIPFGFHLSQKEIIIPKEDSIVLRVETLQWLALCIQILAVSCTFYVTSDTFLCFFSVFIKWL